MIRKTILVIFFSLFLCSCSSPAPSSENIQKTVKNENVKIETTEIPEKTEEEIIDDKTETEIENDTEEVIDDDIIKINCSEKELECYNLINSYRQENGLDVLVWDDKLYEYAKIRASEASIKWSHTRPDGTSWKGMDPDIFQGENLAKGYDTAQDAVNAWIASQGHKENILRENFTRTAISFYESKNGWFWCQTFGY